MSYEKAMKWAKKHPKGTHQDIIMSTRSGFWPSRAWLEQDWRPYVAACEAIEIEPMEQERFYHACLRGRIMSGMTHANRAEYTRLRGLSGLNGVL